MEVNKNTNKEQKYGRERKRRMDHISPNIRDDLDAEKYLYLCFFFVVMYLCVLKIEKQSNFHCHIILIFKLKSSSVSTKELFLLILYVNYHKNYYINKLYFLTVIRNMNLILKRLTVWSYLFFISFLGFSNIWLLESLIRLKSIKIYV